MLVIYRGLINALNIFSPLIVFFRIKNKKEDPLRYKEKYAVRSKDRKKGKLIWFHGSSVGEIMSIMPLVNHYEKNKNIKKILITSNTLSSSRILKNLKLKKTVHQFYPIDHFIFVKRFLEKWKPDIAIFIDSEIWPLMFKEIRQRKIPLLLLNARITKRSFDNWSKLGKFSKLIFKNIIKAYPQNKESEYYLKKLKVKNIKTIGNLKFIDNKLFTSDKNKLNSKFKKYKVWIAASTHSGEEILCAKAHMKLKNKIKNLITIIIPRHIDRVNEIISDFKKMDLKTVLHSSKNKNLNNIDIYLVDTFGESKKFYQIGSSVFLGKSITVKGGQNPLEPIHHGAQILHGPYVDNFKDVYRLLKYFKASKM